MIELISSIWQADFALFPILTVLATTVLLQAIRRRTKFFYAPMYAPYLFDHLNSDLSIYYGSSYLSEPKPMSDEELSAVEARLKSQAVISSVFSAVVVPVAGGVAAGALLDFTDAAAYTALVTAYRAWRVRQSYIGFHHHAEATKHAYNTLILVFAVYLIVSTGFTWHTYLVANKAIYHEGIEVIASQLATMVTATTVSLGLTSAVAVLLTTKIANRETRLKRVEHVRTQREQFRKMSAAFMEFEPSKQPGTGGAGSRSKSTDWDVTTD